MILLQATLHNQQIIMYPTCHLDRVYLILLNWPDYVHLFKCAFSWSSFIQLELRPQPGEFQMHILDWNLIFFSLFQNG